MLALCWLMLGSCWLMLALCFVKLVHVGSGWLHVGLQMPKMGPKSLQEPPKWAKITSKTPKMGPKMRSKSWFSRYLFEKAENPFGATIVMYFWYFGGRICSIFEDKSVIFWIKFGNSGHTPLKIVPRGLLDLFKSQLDPSWHQDAKKLAKIGLRKKAFLSQENSSWRQDGPKTGPEGPRRVQNQLQEAPGGSPEGSWEGPGMVLEPRGAPGGPRGAKIAPRAFKMTQNWVQKSFKFDPKSIKSMTSKSFQKQLPSLATLS